MANHSHITRHPWRLAVAAALAGAALAPGAASAAPDIYWGSYISGSTYERLDAPFDIGTMDTFEANAGKRASIIHWGQPWFWGTQGGYQAFPVEMAERVRARGSIPMISWGSWDLDRTDSLNHPQFRLQRIIDGHHDAYLRQWARDLRDWGHPLFIRFNHEMNGHWYPWSERANGNQAGEFARMWRHVVQIFREEGAVNATWLWAPNHTFDGDIPLQDVYPGPGYIDWAGISGYNWGADPVDQRNSWRSFQAVHRATYDALATLAPDKPVMIAETAASELGGSKAAWISNALKVQVPSWPRVKAVVWFNWNTEAARGINWVIESSPKAQRAFSSAINSRRYAANDFAELPRLSKVQPLGVWPPRRASLRASRTANISSPRRCRASRHGCVRVVFRSPAGPPARARFGVRAREAVGGRTLSRRVGRVGAGKRRVVTLPIRRRPRCGAIAVRVTIRRSGHAPLVLTGDGAVRRFCASPLARTPRR